ncbi:hypothetical protein MMC07_008412, partial [Pseudocyphellaria aurata]|nr:hypothetical protein [Pseudocyphellaria aurata]
MQRFAATWYLVALLATLAVVTTALPQSHSGIPEGIFRRRSPARYRAPRGCRYIQAKVPHDYIDLKLEKRDSQSPETVAGALHPRDDTVALPCGLLHGGKQSKIFIFWTTQTIQMFWHFGTRVDKHDLVRLMRVNSSGRDLVEQVAFVGISKFKEWTPEIGVRYYVEVLGESSSWMTWFFGY